MPLVVGGAFQNVGGGAVPVVAAEKPPEGKKAFKLTVKLTGLIPTVYQQLTPTLFGISQIVSILIDNTLNPVPILVTAGATDINIIVNAYEGIIAPVFSSPGPFNLTVGALDPSLLVAPITVPVTLLNYERHPANWINQGATAVISPTSLFYFLLTLQGQAPGVYFDLSKNQITLQISATGILSGSLGAWFLVEINYAAPVATPMTANLLVQPKGIQIGTGTYQGVLGSNCYISGPFSAPAVPQYPFPLDLLGTVIYDPAIVGPAGAVYQYMTDNLLSQHGVGWQLPAVPLNSNQTIGVYIKTGN